ncbi:peptidoglycan-binding protein [Streptomyces sp. NPDC048389]|uniref:peptidoglycan-binding domain-containing protein n=1 Tax=Streptomyces sp. NPDC048389 TaxID=3154622 RepID=UPI003456C9FC
MLREGAGHLDVEIDGIFGRITGIATKEAQSRCGTGVDGTIGPGTRRCPHAFDR